MSRCGNTGLIEDEARGFRQITDALDHGLIPEVRLPDGRMLRIKGYRGKKIFGQVNNKYGAAVTIRAKDLKGALLDTHTQAMKEYRRSNSARDQEDARALDEEMTEALGNMAGKFTEEIARRHLDSQADARAGQTWVGGSKWTKPQAFFGKLWPARHLLSSLYDKAGENLQVKHGVKIESSLIAWQESKRYISNIFWERVLGHMTTKEANNASRMLFWLLDGSHSKEIRVEFGRDPTANEYKAAHLARAFFGTSKGRGLHGYLGIEGFIDEYIPHMRRARELKGVWMEKAANGEQLTKQEFKEWQKMEDRGIVPAGGINAKNFHKLQRSGKLESYEDNFLFVFDRYLDVGLRSKYFEPIIKEIEAEYGVSFNRHLGKWRDNTDLNEQEYRLLSMQETKGIGQTEKELLLNHLKSVLRYPTDFEIGVTRGMQAVVLKLQEVFPENALINRIPVGNLTFAGFARGTQGAMYAGGLGYRLSSALKQATGFPITVAFLGPKWSAYGVGRLAAGPTEAFKRAREAGLFQEFLPARDKDASMTRNMWKKVDNSSMILFEIGDNAQRVVAYEGGKAKAMHLKDRLNVEHVRDMGARNRLNNYKAGKNWEAFAEEYGHVASHESQFKYGRGESPLHFRSDLGRFAGMFMTWPMYFTGNLVHWTYGSYKRAYSKAGGSVSRTAVLGSKEMAAKLAPLMFSLWVMQRVAEETDTDMSSWLIDMFEVPVRGGPGLKMAYDSVNLGNAGVQRLVAELGSEKWQELAQRNLDKAQMDWWGSHKLLIPFSGAGSDVMRAKKMYGEHGIRPLFGLRKFEE